MIARLVSVLGIALPFMITVAVCWVAVSRTRREPRRLSNAYWLLAGLIMLAVSLSVLGVPGAGSLLGVLFLLVLSAPLLIMLLAVFLILNGFVMVRRERPSPANLLSLLVGLALLVLVMVTLPVLLSGNRWPIVALSVVVIATGYVGFQFVAYLGYSLLYPLLVRGYRADWVVVLGAGLSGGERVTPLLAARVRTGLEQASRRGAQRMVLSGGQGSDEQIPEAVAMARWAVEHGADPAHLMLETESRTTEQNLRFTAVLLMGSPEIAAAPSDKTPDLAADSETAGPGPGPGLVVTSNYHVMRAALLARRLGISAQACGAPTAGYYWPSAVIREFIAVLAERPLLHAIVCAVLALPLPILVGALALAS